MALGTRSRTFRLASYERERLFETVRLNLADVEAMIAFGSEHDLLLLRISAGLVPFASHDVMADDWLGEFAALFAAVGRRAGGAGMRLSVHPGQFVLINSPRHEVWEASRRELLYQASLLDAFELPSESKIQIHVGGVYGEREASLARWLERYGLLPEPVRRRLVIENDERLFPLEDCLWLSERSGIPVLFDAFHHELHNRGEAVAEGIEAAAATWGGEHGRAQMDYSDPDVEKRLGAHGETLDASRFRAFAAAVRPEVDVMIGMKDKETSALRAREIVFSGSRVGTRLPPRTGAASAL